MTLDVEQMPSRIWATPDTSNVSDEWKTGWFNGRPTERSTLPYVRGDLFDAQAAEIAALKAQVARYEAAMEEIEGVGFDAPMTWSGSDGEWAHRRAGIMQARARAALSAEGEE